MKIMSQGREIPEKEFSLMERYYESKILQDEFDSFTATPAEGKWFVVRPLKINQELFKEKRDDLEQEKMRLRILKAFENMKKDRKYERPFKTLFPMRLWEKYKGQTPKDLLWIAKSIGEDEADETEQALEWAQRIFNGESWEALCNTPDTARSYRMIRGSHYGLFKVVGGSKDTEPKGKTPASDILKDSFVSFEKLGCTVPLIVSYSNIPEE